MLETNLIINSDCLTYLKTLPDESIDLVVTSPPYAMQRKEQYGGVTQEEYPEWFYEIGKEIHRVLKPTGSFVLNIKEHVAKGIRSTYVMETVLMLAKLFRFTDTFIWNKPNPFPTGSKRRLKDGFEYIYWFTKTNKYKCFPENVLVESTSKYKEAEKRRNVRQFHGTNNGSNFTMSTRVCGDWVRPSNVLTIPCGCYHNFHPAAFPIELPTFFIKFLTEENDIVLDPFSGSGTTCLASKQLKRLYVGIELSEEYVEKSKERLDSIDKD